MLLLGSATYATEDKPQEYPQYCAYVSAGEDWSKEQMAALKRNLEEADVCITSEDRKLWWTLPNKKVCEFTFESQDKGKVEELLSSGGYSFRLEPHRPMIVTPSAFKRVQRSSHQLPAVAAASPVTSLSKSETLKKEEKVRKFNAAAFMTKSLFDGSYIVSRYQEPHEKKRALFIKAGIDMLVAKDINDPDAGKRYLKEPSLWFDSIDIEYFRFVNTLSSLFIEGTTLDRLEGSSRADTIAARALFLKFQEFKDGSLEILNARLDEAITGPDFPLVIRNGIQRIKSLDPSRR